MFFGILGFNQGSLNTLVCDIFLMFQDHAKCIRLLHKNSKRYQSLAIQSIKKIFVCNVEVGTIYDERTSLVFAK